ncbi:hypothetical protein [Acetobacterium sp. UBA5834]|jgi:hypothetical protein|uniref:hypothetical protein n=1 Tax=Acetobacterium sp. UBA5834 TaxID=1945907 RepID=UPI002579CF2C|nr:hypothetical protein [Acetobacterium sp. UBA5834]
MKDLIKHIRGKETVACILILLSLFAFTGCNGPSADNSGKVVSQLNGSGFEGYTLIEVDGGDLSGQHQPNVVVDIGYGDRQDYALPMNMANWSK